MSLYEVLRCDVAAYADELGGDCHHRGADRPAPTGGAEGPHGGSKDAVRQQLKQIGLALHMYANDNNGRLRIDAHDGVQYQKAWIYTLSPYLENVDKIRICPVDPKAEDRLKFKSTSYVLNEYVTVPGPDAQLNLFQMPATSRTIVIFPGADSRGASVFSDHTHSRNWFRLPTGAWNRILQDIQPDRFGLSPPEHTSGHANYLYGDGHVDVIAAAQVRPVGRYRLRLCEAAR
jgi:prepilin-type processing-associated H-X9-DG protein